MATTISPNIVFINNISGFRKHYGMLQSDLAKRLGVSKNTVSAWETGQYSPSAFHAALLCEIFDCRFSDLFSIYYL